MSCGSPYCGTCNPTVSQPITIPPAEPFTFSDGDFCAECGCGLAGVAFHACVPRGGTPLRWPEVKLARQVERLGRQLEEANAKLLAASVRIGELEAKVSRVLEAVGERPPRRS